MQVADELRAEIAALLTDIQDIDAQLSSRERVDSDGKRLEGEEYWSWRHAAIHARTKKLQQYRERKRELHQLADSIKERPKRYTYFVSFARATGFGWVAVMRDYKIETADQLLALEEFLKAQDGGKGIAILWFSILSAEDIE